MTNQIGFYKSSPILGNSKRFVTAMSLNKTIAIIFPFHVNILITRNVTMAIIANLTLFNFGLYLMCLWSYGLLEWCQPLPEYAFLTKFEIIFALIKTYSCFTIIFVCSFICVYSLRKHKLAMKMNMSTKAYYDQVSRIMNIK